MSILRHSDIQNEIYMMFIRNFKGNKMLYPMGGTKLTISELGRFMLMNHMKSYEFTSYEMK